MNDTYIEHLTQASTEAERTAIILEISLSSLSDEVKTAVSAATTTLSPNGTGMLVAPSHRMMTDIPVENVVAMLDAFKELA